MSGFNCPWYIAGGWAIDLYLGRERRTHDDLDIAAYRSDQLVLQKHLAGWNLMKFVGPDGAEYLEPWSSGEWLELPVFQIVLELNSEGYPALEVLLNESSGDQWLWRKNLEVRYPISRIGMRSVDGIPYLSPEIVLLYKSRHVVGGSINEETDQHDFNDVRDILDHERRTWLRSTLQTWYPDHPWIVQL